MEKVENARLAQKGTNAQRRRAARTEAKLRRRGAAGWASSDAAERAQVAGRRSPGAAMQQLAADLDRAGMRWIDR